MSPGRAAAIDPGSGSLSAALHLVHTEGPIRRSELTSRLGLSRGAVGALVEELRVQQLVAVETSPLPAGDTGRPVPPGLPPPGRAGGRRRRPQRADVPGRARGPRRGAHRPDRAPPPAADDARSRAPRGGSCRARHPRVDVAAVRRRRPGRAVGGLARRRARARGALPPLARGGAGAGPDGRSARRVRDRGASTSATTPTWPRWPSTATGPAPVPPTCSSSRRGSGASAARSSRPGACTPAAPATRSRSAT